MFFILLFAKV